MGNQPNKHLRPMARRPSISHIYVSDPSVTSNSTKDTLFVSQPTNVEETSEPNQDTLWTDIFKPRTKFESTMGAKLGYTDFFLSFSSFKQFSKINTGKSKTYARGTLTVEREKKYFLNQLNAKLQAAEERLKAMQSNLQVNIYCTCLNLNPP